MSILFRQSDTTRGNFSTSGKYAIFLNCNYLLYIDLLQSIYRFTAINYFVMQNLHLHNLHNACIQMLFLQTRQMQIRFLHYVYDYVFVFDYVYDYVFVFDYVYDYVFVFDYDYSSNI